MKKLQAQGKMHLVCIHEVRAQCAQLKVIAFLERLQIWLEFYVFRSFARKCNRQSVIDNDSGNDAAPAAAPSASA